MNRKNGLMNPIEIFIESCLFSDKLCVFIF